MITINSFDTGLTQDERAKLYPRCGQLHPYGLQELQRTDNFDSVRDVAARYPVRQFFYVKKNLFFIVLAIQSIIRRFRTESR
jgi:hypothetical protein